MAGVARRPSTIRAAGTESERGMSPVHIDELTPETRARVLKQIEETEAGTTALAVIEPKNHPSVQKPSSQLAKLEQARQMLAESRTLSEVKQVRDIAEAARVYAKAANLGHDAQNYAAEIALLAARKAGDILKQLEKSKGGEPTKKKNSTAASVAGVESEYAKTLKETGTPERTAQRWQEIAAIPQETFTEYIESVKPTEDISATGLLNAAKPPHVPKPKPEKPIAEYKSLVDAIPAVHTGGVEIPPSQYGVAEIEESVTAFAARLVSQLKSASDKKIAYASLIRTFQDLLGGL